MTYNELSLDGMPPSLLVNSVQGQEINDKVLIRCKGDGSLGELFKLQELD